MTTPPRATWLDALTALLLVAALVGMIFPREVPPAQVALPMMTPGEPAPMGPGAPSRAILAKVVTVGELLTVEDLARGVLAMEQGALPGVSPLDAATREEVARRLSVANARREELLELETRLAQEDARLAEAARAIAETLTPEQRAWILAERDRASVAGVERAYWDAVLEAMGTPTPRSSP